MKPHVADDSKYILGIRCMNCLHQWYPSGFNGDSHRINKGNLKIFSVSTLTIFNTLKVFIENTVNNV